MTLRLKILRGSAMLILGEGISGGCSFIRNIILARLLTKADFGVAASFALTVALLEMTGKMSVDRLVVQAEEGDDRLFQSTVQAFHFGLGILSAGMVYLLARPISLCFGIPESCWAFQLLAVIPFLKGLFHLDVNRFERRMEFRPVVAISVVPQIFSVLAAWPAVLWLGDFRALLFLMMAKEILSLALSHTLAERRYGLRIQRGHLRRILVFGGPLLINGFLLFCIFQGDRFIIGAAYSMADLGVYSVAAQFALVPGFMIVKVLGSVLLPLLSAVQDSPEEFRRRYALSARFLCLVAAGFSTSLIIAGEWIISEFFGQKYAGAGVLIGWLAAGQALRIMRAAPTIAAMAQADTKNLMVSNVYRLVGLVLAVWVVARRQDLYLVAVSALVGEGIALVFSTVRLSRQHRLRLLDGVLPGIPALLLMGSAGLLAWFGIQRSGAWVVVPLAVCFPLVSLTASTLLFRELRREFLEALRSVGTRYSRFSTLWDSRGAGREE